MHRNFTDISSPTSRSLMPILSHSVVRDPTATIVEKKGNVPQVVWSTASLNFTNHT